MTKKYALQIKDLVFSKGGKDILDNLNLKIPKRGVYSLLGHNGAGKSSLAYIIMGIEGYRPKKGSVIIHNKDFSNVESWKRARQGISIAWQEPPIFDGLTVEEYLKISSKDKTSTNKINYCLSLMGLNPEAYLRRGMDHSLSGGERKRIELSSLLVAEPNIAILDEPDSGIDMMSISTIKKAIKYLQNLGSTVLLITHREELAKISDKIGILCAGYLQQEGPAREILRLYKLKCDSCENRG